jgi:iron complex outermembrane receptor protein
MLRDMVYRLTCLMIGCSMAFAVWADGQQAGTTSSSLDTAQTLQEVVVTARRREGNVQKVPISVSVVSAEDLRSNKIENFSDLQYLAPSLAAPHGLGANQTDLNIRGQGTNAAATACSTRRRRTTTAIFLS